MIPSRGVMVSPPPTPPPAPPPEDDDDDGPEDGPWASSSLPPRCWGEAEKDEDGTAVVTMPEVGGGGETIVAALLAWTWTRSAGGRDDDATLSAL
jgi:hypothetical protein